MIGCWGGKSKDGIVLFWSLTILFIGGIQLSALAIIGEYLGRLFEEIKPRPLYLVDEVISKDGSVGLRVTEVAEATNPRWGLQNMISDKVSSVKVYKVCACRDSQYRDRLCRVSFCALFVQWFVMVGTCVQ